MLGIEKDPHRSARRSKRKAERATKPAVSIGELIEDEVRFFRTWATSPLKIGAVIADEPRAGAS